METNTKILITSAVVGTGAVIGYLLLTSRGAQAQPTETIPVTPLPDCPGIDKSVQGSTVYTREPQNWPVVEIYRGVQVYNRGGAYHIFTTAGVSEAANINDIRRMIDDACVTTAMGCPTCQYGADETVPYGWGGYTIGNYTDVYGANEKTVPYGYQGRTVPVYSDAYGADEWWNTLDVYGGWPAMPKISMPKVSLPAWKPPAMPAMPKVNTGAWNPGAWGPALQKTVGGWGAAIQKATGMQKTLKPADQVPVVERTGTGTNGIQPQTQLRNYVYTERPEGETEQQICLANGYFWYDYGDGKGTRCWAQPDDR